MYNEVYSNLMNAFDRDRLSITELKAIFKVEHFSELFDIIIEYFDENIEDIVLDKEFVAKYHLFLYNVTDHEKKEGHLFKLKEFINSHRRAIKKSIKVYTKENKPKDVIFTGLNQFANLLNVNDQHLYPRLVELNEKEDYLVIRFLVDTIKNPDYLFRIFQLHPDYVNIKNQEGHHLFYLIVEYYLSSLREMSEEDIKYYKRIFLMLLESDNFELTNAELNEILKLCDQNELGKDHTFFKDIDFLRDSIKNRYKIINTGYRETAKDHVNKQIKVPQIIVPKIEDRTDLTNLFTISIDSSRSSDVSKMLFDDAFSMNVNSMGNYILYVHIPDVDCYIPRKGEIEDFMRGLGESVYAKDMVTPLLSYSIASKCSLEHGKVKPSLTYMIKIDPKGNVKDIAFFKSLVNVNYNMSCAQANTFMINNSDERLNILNPMYELAAKLRRKRGERIGNRTKSYVIMDEFNIIADLAVAAYFNDQNIIFPYKNYKGKKSPVSQINIDQTEQFIRVNNISEEGRELINTIFDINNRVFYDTVNHGNTAYKGKPVGNVGNPMREYISLETDRLIKDLIIDKIGNEDAWREKIERDCIEYTETSAKIKELYSMNKR